MGTIKKLYQDQLVGGSGGAGQEVYPVTSTLGVYDTDNNQLQGVLDKVTTNLGLFTCGTAAATAAKTVSASKFVLMEGGSVKIKFTYANSADSPTLAIGSTAAKPIMFNGSAASASNSWGAGEIVEFFYDGTNWVGNSTSVSVSQNTPTGTNHTRISVGGNNYDVASVEDVSQLGQEINGTLTKDVSWSNGYIQSGTGLVKASSVSKFSQPILLKAGERVTVGTQNSNIGIICSTNADSVAVGDTVTIIQTTSQSGQFETYEYTAIDDIKIIVCVLASNYTLSFYDTDNLTEKVENCATTEELNQLGQDVDNPEWIKVVTDQDGRILYGIKNDGKFYFGAGCPPQVIAQIKDTVDIEKIESPEWLEVVVDMDGKIISGTRRDGTKVISKLKNYLLDNKVDKVPGKILSSNDFTDKYKSGLDVLAPDPLSIGDVTLAPGEGAASRFSLLFDKPLAFKDFAELTVVIDGYDVIGTDDDKGFSIQAWYKFPTSGDNPTPVRPFSVKGNESVSIPSKGNEYLYGIYFYTANRSIGTVSFNANIVAKSLPSAVQVMIEQGRYLQVPDYYLEDDYLNRKIRVVSDYIRKTIINGDAFYFVTDTHWEYNMHHSPAIIRYMNNILSVPRLFHGGDMYHRGLEIDKYGVGCINAFRSAMDNPGQVYTADGNHEFMTQTETYGDIFAETRIYLKDVVYGGSHKNYYYVNNNQKKIRYVVLYSYGEYVNGSITNGFIDQEQLTWFNDTALNVEQGWEIFVFCHFITAIRPSGSWGEIVGASNIYNIINNYHGNGKIIAIIEGHTHWDAVMLDSCNVPIIATTCDHNYPFSYSGHTDFEELIEPRTNGTINEQAFDVVIYDKENGLINMVRVGSRALNLSNSHAGDAQVDYRSVFVNGMTIGDNKTLETPLTGIVTWQSADPNVVSVNDGNITAISAGDTVITATSDNGEKHSFFIKVNQ